MPEAYRQASEPNGRGGQRLTGGRDLHRPVIIIFFWILSRLPFPHAQLGPRFALRGEGKGTLARWHSFSRTPLARCLRARVLFMFICIATFISHPPPLLCCGAILPCRLATSEAGFASVRLFYSIFLFLLLSAILLCSACEGDCDLFGIRPPPFLFPCSI